MESLSFFDCNCTFGLRRVVHPGSFYKIDDLIKKMKCYDIKKALVYHSMAKEYNPMIGNEMLMSEIKGRDYLYPAWVIMPHHTGEFPQPAILKNQMKSSGIKAVLLFPSPQEQNYSIAEWNCGELFLMLEKCCVPVLIGLEQLTLNELYELCSNFPNLKIILTNVSYRIDRNLYRLLEKLPNLYIETSGYKVNNGIEEICKRFGARRLVFGSGMPLYSGGAAVSMINYARISENEKRMIACENIESLLGGVYYD